jgi:hypothetical protein
VSRDARSLEKQRNIFGSVSFEAGVTRWRIWLRHYTTGRKAADSIPDGVIRGKN